MRGNFCVCVCQIISETLVPFPLADFIAMQMRPVQAWNFPVRQIRPWCLVPHNDLEGLGGTAGSIWPPSLAALG